jgi:hypothetical protein
MVVQLHVLEKNSQLSIIRVRGGKVTDNPKPQLKQEQSKYGTKWI